MGLGVMCRINYRANECGPMSVAQSSQPAQLDRTIKISVNIDRPMRQVRALTVRFLVPSSFTRKNNPENRLMRIANSNITMSSFTNNIVLGAGGLVYGTSTITHVCY